MSTLRPLIAWIIGPWVAAILVWIGTKTGQAADPELISKTTEQVVDVILVLVPLLLSLAGVSKQLINRFVNPLNTSAPIEDPRVGTSIKEAVVSNNRDEIAATAERLARDESGYSRQSDFPSDPRF